MLWLQELGAKVWEGAALVPDPDPNLFRQLAEAPPPGEQRSWRHHKGDLRDLVNWAAVVEDFEPDVVLRLAAQPLVRTTHRARSEPGLPKCRARCTYLRRCAPNHPLSVVMVTTDKVYANREWSHGCRECDRLGGHDPSSASNQSGGRVSDASWRASFCGSSPHQSPHLAIATARAGNVIIGGDWAEEWIVPDAVPDAVRALAAGEPIPCAAPRPTAPGSMCWSP